MGLLSTTTVSAPNPVMIPAGPTGDPKRLPTTAIGVPLTMTVGDPVEIVSECRSGGTGRIAKCGNVVSPTLCTLLPLMITFKLAPLGAVGEGGRNPTGHHGP